MKARKPVVLTLTVLAGLLALVLAGLTGSSRVRAQSSSVPAAVGSWLVTGSDGSVNVVAIHADGTAELFSKVLDGDGTASSGAAGVWSQIADREFLVTFVEIASNPQQRLLATAKFRVDVKVDDTGDKFGASGKIDVVGVDGKSLQSDSFAGVSGQRIKVEQP
jgi:hypothetical protein